ncbi:MAG: TadE family protein [Planctomycetales bacterium]
MRNRNETHGRGGARRGFLSLELALTLPILGVVLFALFEFSLLFFARSEVAQASRAGARLAAAPGVSAAEVEDRVRSLLGPRLNRRMQVRTDLGEETGDVVRVAVAVPMNDASPDLLWPIGYSLRGRSLLAETRMVRE